MKKKYILIPIACVTLLIAITVCVAIMLRSSYLQKSPYDHISDTVYNGVEIVGEDGLFYLVKNGQKISNGYISLKSVNDLYPDIDGLICQGKDVVLFDYYIARTNESPDHLLVSSDGTEILIVGESYSLDTQSTRLPFLVFTNNANGTKAAVSLQRLDSDISYKSGNEITLRPFKSINAIQTSADMATAAYLEAEDISDKQQKSYFRSDGIKITTGEDVSTITLRKKSEPNVEYTYLHNITEQSIVSINGDVIALGVIERYRTDDAQWQSALCFNSDTSAYHIVVFSPDKTFTLSAMTYDLNTLSFFGNCVIAGNVTTATVDIIGLSGATLGSYTSVTPNGKTLAAQNADGSFSYLNTDGKVLMTGNYQDMTCVDSLSNEKCTVFSSETYDQNNGSQYYHFTKEHSEVLTLDVSSLVISTLHSDYPTFLVNRDGRLSILSPFSATKESAQYDHVSLNDHNGVVWILAQSYERGIINIIDPLTAKAVTSIVCSDEDIYLLWLEVEDVSLPTSL